MGGILTAVCRIVPRREGASTMYVACVCSSNVAQVVVVCAGMTVKWASVEWLNVVNNRSIYWTFQPQLLKNALMAETPSAIDLLCSVSRQNHTLRCANTCVV